jgi:ferric-dicitrate binding protein FerR (iron transport regulator)
MLYRNELMNENYSHNNLLVSYFSGSATETEKQELFSWIQQSHENERYYFAIKELFEAGKWENLKKDANTPELWRKLVTKVDQPLGKKYTRQYLTILKYAAVFIFGVFTFWLAQTLVTNGGNVFKHQVVTGIGERTQIILPDGTKVWVNSCSSISYLSDYGKENRDVYLNGEAYFEVVKNTSSPFVVNASGFKVKALGTSFNVSAYGDDNEIAAVLLEGSVSFGNEEYKPEVIKPGEKISFNKSSHKMIVNQVNPEIYSAWSKGENQFEYLTLEEIVKRLQRSYNVTIVIDKEKIKDMHFSGTFRNYENLEQIIKVISLNTGLKYKMLKDTVYLK